MTTIPFKFDRAEGFVTIKGSARLEGDDLVLRTSEAMLEMVPVGSETFRVPASEIESIEVEKTAFRCRLRVRVLSPEVLHGFPGEPVDELVLPIARKHAAAAAELAHFVRLRNLPR